MNNNTVITPILIGVPTGLLLAYLLPLTQIPNAWAVLILLLVFGALTMLVTPLGAFLLGLIVYPAFSMAFHSPFSIAVIVASLVATGIILFTSLRFINKRKDKVVKRRVSLPIRISAFLSSIFTLLLVVIYEVIHHPIQFGMPEGPPLTPEEISVWNMNYMQYVPLTSLGQIGLLVWELLPLIFIVGLVVANFYFRNSEAIVVNVLIGLSIILLTNGILVGAWTQPYIAGGAPLLNTYVFALNKALAYTPTLITAIILSLAFLEIWMRYEVVVLRKEEMKIVKEAFEEYLVKA